MVDEDGRVRLIDFGIARALDAADGDEELTIAGLELMTPAYASPEQLRGEPLSLASDVYALGVIAYRLLTGAMPHGGRRRQELARGIEASPPRRPSDAASLAPVPAGRLRGDLDAILLTALRAEPERRYPSVEALREDLARHLDGRPVLARGDTFAYVAGRFVRRHAAAVILAGVAVAALVGAAAGGLTLWQRSETARREAERQRATAERVRGLLAELLETADPAAAGARADLTVRQALDAAGARLARDLADEPQAAAALHLTIGNAYANLGLHEQGAGHLDAARALYAQGPAADPAGLALAAVRQCELALKRGDLAAADSLLAAALAVEEPATRAAAQLALSRLRTEQSRLDEAAAAATTAASLSAGAPDEPALRARVASQLGSVRYRQGRYAEAESLLQDAHRRAAATFGPEHVLTAEAQQDLGVALTALGRPQDAAAAFAGALAVYERLYPPGHPEFAVTLNNLAEAESAAGRHAAALGRFEQARAVIEANYGRAHAQWAVVVNGMAFSRWRLGQTVAADSLYLESVAALAGALGEHHPWTAVVRTNLARVRHELGRADEARDQAERARADLETAFPDGHVYAARPLVLLAELALARGDDADAASLLARADAQAAAAPPGGGDRVAIGILAARLERRAGRSRAAEAILDSLATLVAANPATAAELTARIAAAR
jgi:serine/threonine-protein kinase